MITPSEIFRMFQPHSKYLTFPLEAYSVYGPESTPANVQGKEEIDEEL
jgi:hypothetical protein